MNVKIENIPLNDRPRERLIINGASSLSNEELLAIILGSGTKDMSALNLAALIISKTEGINNLKKISYHELTKIKGVGKAKACQIVSINELCRRISKSNDDFYKIKLNDVKKVYEFYKYKVSDSQEEFYCVYLDAKKRVIEEKLLFKGTVNHSLVHPRDIFKKAYSLNAAFIICVHNHPSGDVNPSVDDTYVTERIKKVGNIMGVKLIDHVIVSNNKYYSFLENGKI